MTTWTLRCAWCDWLIYVGARGGRGNDPGAGVEAADSMERHVRESHAKSWREYLDATREPEAVR